MLQDPLALLSGSSDADDASASEEEEKNKEEGPGRCTKENDGDDDLPPAKRRRASHDAEPPRNNAVPLAFRDLQVAGYKPAELLESERYLRDAESLGRRCSALVGVAATESVACTEEVQDAGLQSPTPHSCEAPLPKQHAAVEVWQRCGSSRPVPAPWSAFVPITSSVPTPTDSLMGLPASLCETLNSAGFFTPTPIQAYALPILATGRDFIGVAQTGSGKTLAYLLPCLAGLLRPPMPTPTIGPRVPSSDAASSGPALLVLGPTRELICQIEREAERFWKTTELTVQTIYGGVPRSTQLAGLRGKPHVVVATPGRLADLVEVVDSFSLASVRYLVLDEADRMLDDGFEAQIRILLKLASFPHRQTILFSATWPTHVQQLAAGLLKDPIEVRVGSVDALKANPDITQEVMLLREESEKLEALVSLLNGKKSSRSIVFVATKRTCKELERSCRGQVFGHVGAIHSDKSQSERESAMEAFRSGVLRVLFATDVAGRGLDVPGVQLVVNFDAPRSAEDYVHRIGRTGRAGERGLAISLLTWQQVEPMRWIAAVMRRTGVPVSPELSSRLQMTDAPTRGAGVDPRASWREPWEGASSSRRYGPKDLANAVSNLYRNRGLGIDE